MSGADDADEGCDLWTRLPVAVYGTLRRGEGNQRVLSGPEVLRVEMARISGVAVYDLGGLPMATEQNDCHVVVELYWLSAGPGDDIRDEIDALESFVPYGTRNDFYLRREFTAVISESGERVQCWLYVAADAFKPLLAVQDLVTGGDWVNARQIQ
ncbi:MAG: gamma-glutamylcyclotransferase family protein [Actinomycetes bacterium]